MDRFIIDALAISSQRLIQPGLERLIVRHGIEPPLVGGLMRSDRDKIILWRAIIKIEIIPADEIKPREFHAIVEVALHGGERLMAIWPKAFTISLHRFDGCLQQGFTGGIVDPKIISVHSDIPNCLRGNLEKITDG